METDLKFGIECAEMTDHCGIDRGMVAIGARFIHFARFHSMPELEEATRGGLWSGRRGKTEGEHERSTGWFRFNGRRETAGEGLCSEVNDINEMCISTETTGGNGFIIKCG